MNASSAQKPLPERSRWQRELAQAITDPRELLAVLALPAPWLESAERAARPTVWISELSERRKPSLSASRMATSDTSGMSSPSRSRLMPTITSNLPSLKSRMISTRSTVSTSECR